MRYRKFPFSRGMGKWEYETEEEPMMKIGFACDHAAVSLKNTLLDYLKGKGHECVDYGVNDPTKRVDYPVMGRRVAEAIKAGEVDKGVWSAAPAWASPWPPTRSPGSGLGCAVSPIPPA